MLLCCSPIIGLVAYLKYKDYKDSKSYGPNGIELSRAELKTIFMAADAYLTQVNGEEKFIFDGVATKNTDAENPGGLVQMSEQELTQIYDISLLRAFGEQEGVDITELIPDLKATKKSMGLDKEQ